MDTELLDWLFEIDSQQQDWREEEYEENGEEETCQGPTIATTETLLQVEISCFFVFFDFIHFVSLFFVMQILLFHVCIVTILIIS